ncbi:putative lipid II flippase FtsW [Hydrogenibacillus schlegelii]
MMLEARTSARPEAALRRRAPDFLFLFLTVAHSVFGLIMVGSASLPLAAAEWGDPFYFVRRQALWLAVALFTLFLAENIRPAQLRKLTLPLLFLAWAGLFTVYLPHLGVELNGSRTWIRLGSLSVQPGELAKPALVLYLAHLLSKKGSQVRTWSRGFLPPFVVVGAFALPLIVQKDLGTALILVGTAFLVLFAGGARIRHLLAVAALSLPPLVLAIVLFPYRLKRITGFLDPWQDPGRSGYHLIQSLYAIAHGGLAGVGLGESVQKFFYLPFPYNDFIFAVLAEELGFLGSGVFLLAYATWIGRGFVLSLRHPDPFAKLLGVGAMSAIAVQALMNLGGVTGLLPITGVTLPLISYGGSSLVVTHLLTGWVLALSRELPRR